MRTELFLNRGRLHGSLGRQGEREHLAKAFLDLSAAMEQFLRFPGLISLRKLLSDADDLVFRAVRDLSAVALHSEALPGGMPLAIEIYERLCRWLKPFLCEGASPELFNAYALALMNAASAGRAVPDRERLEQSLRVFTALSSNHPEVPLYGQNRNSVAYTLTLWPASADGLKALGIRNPMGAWLPLSVDGALADRLFRFPEEIPEGAYGERNGNYQLSSYRCPHCGHRLYKTVFPAGNDPRLPLAPDGSRILEPARIFLSPCGRFFASPKGRRLTDGFFVQAILVFDPAEEAQWDEFIRWCGFFNDLGSLNAKRWE